MISHALFLEPQPFIMMTEDDNPWAEGLFLTLCVGIIAGCTQWLGGLITSLSYPSGPAVLEAFLRAGSQLNAQLDFPIASTELNRLLTQTWHIATASGFLDFANGTAWDNLLGILLMPVMLILQWVTIGCTAYLIARRMGGTGTLNQTLGATSLFVAPKVLLFFTIIPFVVVNSFLLNVWGLLIVYRAVQTAQKLQWRRAAIVTILSPLSLALLLGLIVGAIAIIVSITNLDMLILAEGV